MKNEIKLVEVEDNKSENDYVIMPTGNCLFSNKYKKNSHIYQLNNKAKSKMSINN